MDNQMILKKEKKQINNLKKNKEKNKNLKVIKDKSKRDSNKF